MNPLQPKSLTDVLAGAILLLLTLWLLNRAAYFIGSMYRVIVCANHSFRAGKWREKRLMKPGDWVIHETLAGFKIKVITKVGADDYLYLTDVLGVSNYGNPAPLTSAIMPYNARIAEYLKATK